MSDPKTDAQNAGRDTRRMLRLAVVVITVMLGVGVSGQAIGAGCFETSISAYYWTAAHPVFLTALSTIGVILVVNKGSGYMEDVLLNLSGFFAFGVAIVPTPRGPSCGGSVLPAGFDAAPLVRNGALAVLIAGIFAEVLRVVVERRSHPVDPSRGWARPVAWLLILGFIGWYFGSPGTFLLYAHVTSALVMFVGMIAVVLLNGAGARRATSPRRFGTAYFWIATAMAVTLAAAIGFRYIGGSWLHLIIVVETLLVVEFAAFWAVQTAELWDVEDRSDLQDSR